MPTARFQFLFCPRAVRWCAVALLSCGADGNETSLGSTYAARGPHSEATPDSVQSVATSSAQPTAPQPQEPTFDSSVPSNVVELLLSPSVLDFEKITDILHYACVTCHLREPSDPLAALDWTLLSLDFTIGRGWIVPGDSGASQFVTSFTQLDHLTSADLPLPVGVNSVLSVQLTQKIAEFIDQL